ncbi:transposase [Thiocapsa sp.]|uniref:transposase n=1 Tax=Thiocapsa sp. TaxID=2024551 RepID=UPI00262E73F7|nr:transposase [Thiocapsa sp.]
MPNHVHLILVPADQLGLRDALGEAHRLYTRMINFREGWRGHLWQERFHLAPSKARRLLPGESPGRVRASHPPVSSVGPVAERRKSRTRDRASVHRESCRPQGRSRSLKCWYSFEIANPRMATGY